MSAYVQDGKSSSSIDKVDTEKDVQYIEALPIAEFDVRAALLSDSSRHN